jgi:CRP-like cAMP-binding protein
MPNAIPAPRSDENKILAALRRSDTPGLLPTLEPVTLAQGTVIYEPDTEIDYVYFPETAIFSMLSMMKDGSTVEVGPVGDEGMVGLRVFLGANSSADQVIVHVAGSALRLKVGMLKGVLVPGENKLPSLLTRYTQMLLAMSSQSAACYKLHHLEQQLARWLLMMSDYVREEDLQLTHELIALTLGVRRSGVTEASITFKNEGIIDYNRGHIQILDRGRLEAKACECYRVIKEEFDRLYADLAVSST